MASENWVEVQIPLVGEGRLQQGELRINLPRQDPSWTLDEAPMPESQPHDLILDLLKSILILWAIRAGRSVQAARNLAVLWVEEAPSQGANPDLCVIEPRTPEGDELAALCTWREGHHPPLLAIEVVSRNQVPMDFIHRNRGLEGRQRAYCPGSDRWDAGTCDSTGAWRR